MQVLLLQIFITQGSKILNSKGLLSSHRFDATSVNPLLRLSVSWQSRGRQAPNISLIPTALARSTPEQGIQDALELGCKCWAQSLLLWEVLNSTKSLQEATSKVQAARKTDLFLNQICTCPSGKTETDSSSGLSYPHSSGFQCCFELRFEWKKIKKQRERGAAGGRNEMSFFSPQCLAGPG